MKTNLLLIAAAVTTLLFTTTSAHAGGYCAPPSYCPPTTKIYKVNTCEIHRCRVKKMAYDHYGRCYTYYVTVVTYRDYYSNGTHRTYRRSYRA